MCGRFNQHYTWAQVHEFLSVIGAPQNLQPRYNIAPTNLVDMVRHNAEGQRGLVRGLQRMTAGQMECKRAAKPKIWHESSSPLLWIFKD